MMGMTDLIINQGVGIKEIFRLIICLLPRMVVFAMPAACLTGVLLAYIRMSSDNEIIALHSSGISLYQTIAPVILFSVISYIIASLMTLYFIPYGNRKYESVFQDMIQSKKEFNVKEGVFLEPVNNIVFFVNSYSPKEKMMKDLFVVDKREMPEKTIVAKSGRIISNVNGGTVIIQLFDGVVYVIEKDGKINTARFKTLPFSIDLKDMFKTHGTKKRDPDEMYIGELTRYIKNPKINAAEKNQAELQLGEIFSLPLSILIIGIIGAPLGAHVRAHGRTTGIIISLVLFLSYYACLMGVRYICEMRIVSPYLGVWIPVLFLFSVCLILMIRSANNLSYGIFERLLSFIQP